MQITRNIQDTREATDAVRHGGRRVTFVPTMGALHVAHVSLMEAAKRDGGFVVVSIFVNPTQFGPNEDYRAYPRDEAADLATCERVGVDLVFIPSTDEMYEASAATTVHVARLTDTLCGRHRPGHFDGVATVVAKLFNIVQPDAAYFGEKDFQQLAVIRQMVRDLDMPLDVVGCPIVREADGLAVSSRNAYLSADERVQATCLHRGLCQARTAIQQGERDPAAVSAAVQKLIDDAGPAAIDYISVVDPASLQPVQKITGPVLVALAVRIGSTRLIDNMQVDPHSTSG